MTWTEAVRVQSSRAQRIGAATVVRSWRVALLIAVLLAWWAIAALGVLPATLVPDPIDVVVALVGLVPTAEYWTAIGLTLLGAICGLIAAILVGIPIGILTGRSQRAELSMRFLLDFGRAFPAVALTGVLVLMLGRDVEMKSVLVFIAVVFPIAIQTQHGVRRVEPMVEETCRAFQIPQGLYVRKVLLPNAAPYIMTGLRLAASVAVLVAISAEVLTNAPGIGERIAAAQIDSNAPKSFAFIVTAGLLGYAVNVGVGALQRRAVRWRPDHGMGD
ncbi:ABC transporter permease [Leucobacter allii]|uniref:ABC transporter permease n=1 Tax=Leucobacter allii TaxID=2932247 RepID=UPI001FD1AF1A|nr:ABC transporter permease [Leucobacter allii]UOR01872.1 ABC transporter permease [Leucobacter allii]